MGDEPQRRAAGAKFCITADLSKCFYQVPLAPTAAPVTATRFGSVVAGYLTAPSQSPQYVQLWTNRIFGLLPGVSVHVDDVLITADTIAELVARLDAVLSRARQWRLTFAAHKLFATEAELPLLGAIVGRGTCAAMTSA